MSVAKRFKELVTASPMKNELRLIIGAGALLSAAAFAVSLIIWGFDISMLIGLFAGWVYVSVGYCYLADTVCKAAQMQASQLKKAKRAVRSCYLMRFLGLFMLCWLGFETELIDPVGILLPQFFPRPILVFSHFKKDGKKGSNNGRS